MKHKRFEENILVDEAYTNYGKPDKNEDRGTSHGIAKNFAETLEYDEQKKWYHQLPEEPSSSNGKPISQEQIEELRKEASSALHSDTVAYETRNSRSGSSDHQWAKTLLNKGAIGDRVAAATILIQESPLHNLSALRNMVNNVKPAKKKDGIVIIDALSELFISDLLIPDAKLRTFEKHLLSEIDGITSGNKQSRLNVLKLWYFEDQLKELYGTYVDSLNKFAHDSVEANKEKAVSSMSYLLMHHPEREKMLLTNIINKLGDPSQGVASKVIYHLCQLLYNHPNMKNIVLTEIEKMLFRSNISPRAQYYGICFLNQFFLGKDDSRIAESLIRIYFSFFKASIKKGEIDSRLMAAILTGVKRAYPFCDPERLSDTASHIEAVHKLVHMSTMRIDGEIDSRLMAAILTGVKRAYPFCDPERLSDTASHIEAVHKLVHMSTMHIAILALALLAHISGGNKEYADRFYSSLYRKLTSIEIYNTNHSALLFSLIYKTMKQDTNIPRVSSFTKRLLQVCCYTAPAQSVAILYLLSQVLKDSGKKSALLLGWTQRKVKEEVKEESISINDTQDPNSSVGSEQAIETADQEIKDECKETKKIDLLKGDKKDLITEDVDEECYVDLKLDEQGNVKPKRKLPQQAASAGWHHAKVNKECDKSNVEEKPTEKELASKILLKKTINMDKEIKEYNPLARNPSYAGADQSAYIELTLLVNHFHPTVKLYAEKILHEQLIQYSGDPIKDFAGIRFLDRFVFKNPKKRTELPQEEGPKRVKGSHPKFAVRKNYTAKGLRSLPVNSASYLNEDASRIPVDERFLYDFLQKRREQKDASDSESDNESVTSEDFESYLDTVTGGRAQENSDEEMDFLSEMEAAKKRGGDKSINGGGDDDEDGGDDLSNDEDDDGSDGGLNIEGSDNESLMSADQDELALEDSGDDNDEFVETAEEKPRKNKSKFNIKGGDELSSLFASAEEFSTILEETATNKKQGSSHAVSNTDNSSTKQLAWEEKRDRWMKGYNKKVLGNKTQGGYKKKNTKNFKNKGGKQNGGFSKMADKKSGKRKGGFGEGSGGKKKKFK